MSSCILDLVRLRVPINLSKKEVPVSPELEKEKGVGKRKRYSPRQEIGKEAAHRAEMVGHYHPAY